MDRSDDASPVETASVIEESVVTCPDCGHRTTARMPIDACQIRYDCPNCGTMLKPKPGDCCVFCSYGSVPCPPVQKTAQHCAQINKDC